MAAAASMPPLPTMLSFKVVLLGDASVGKSCLAVRFARGEFCDWQEPTVGAAFLTQRVDLGTEVVKFDIWDTAGQERFKSIVPMYYRGAAAAIVVFDVTCRASFEAAKAWVLEVSDKDMLVALVGNKVDLVAARDVDGATASEYAKSRGLLYMETSAKTGRNAAELFHEIAALLAAKRGWTLVEEKPAPGLALGWPSAGLARGLCCAGA